MHKHSHHSDSCNHDDHDHHDHLHPHHEHHFHGHHHYSDSKNLGVAFFLNFAFMLVELTGGFYTNSVAVMSDALHDFGDSLTLAIAWGLQLLSEKGRDKHYSYGYKRFSVLGAIITSMVLLLGSLIIIYMAVQRLQEPQEAHGIGMMFLALLGILVNGAVLLRLKNASSVNARAIMLHFTEDVLGWVAVLIGSLGIWLFDWYILDPLLSLGIALYILYNVYKNLKYAFKIILQGIPHGIDLQKVIDKMSAHPMVVDVHDMHIWSLDGEFNILTAHVVINNSETSLNQILPVKKELEKILKGFGIEHSTLAFESIHDDCGLTECSINNS